jgi:hypothetical protein
MTHDEFQARVYRLMENYRSRCLWSWPRHYAPRSEADVMAVLNTIERHGDLAAFREVAALRQWLLHPSNNASADS